MEWVSDALLSIIEEVPPSVVLEIRLFITGVGKRALLGSRGNNSIGGDIENRARTEESSKAVMKVLTSPAVRVQPGRPYLDGLLKDKIFSAAGDISVNGMRLDSILEKFINRDCSVWERRNGERRSIRVT